MLTSSSGTIFKVFLAQLVSIMHHKHQKPTAWDIACYTCLPFAIPHAKNTNYHNIKIKGDDLPGCAGWDRDTDHADFHKKRLVLVVQEEPITCVVL